MDGCTVEVNGPSVPSAASTTKSSALEVRIRRRNVELAIAIVAPSISTFISDQALGSLFSSAHPEQGRQRRSIALQDSPIPIRDSSSQAGKRSSIPKTACEYRLGSAALGM